MATSKTAITPSTIHGWLSSLGYLFPSTEGELARFEKLQADMIIPEEEWLDPDIILGNKPKKLINTDKNAANNFLMAARNGKGNVPKNILNKMKKNHQKPKQDNDGPPQKETE